MKEKPAIRIKLITITIAVFVFISAFRIDIKLLVLVKNKTDKSIQTRASNTVPDAGDVHINMEDNDEPIQTRTSHEQVEMWVSDKFNNSIPDAADVHVKISPDVHPRAIIANPCSGSSATMRFTEKILLAHGYSIWNAREPTHDKPEEAMNEARERLKDKIDHEPTLNEIQAELFVYLNEKAKNNGDILLFKIHSINSNVLEALQGLGTKFASTYRQNIFDQSICALRDCFRDGILGDQVYTNGTIADMCFDRRKNDEKLQARFSDAKTLFNDMKHREKADRRHARQYKNLHHPAKRVPYEDLFKFEYTDNENVFQLSVRAWCEFVKTFGVIKESIVEEVLREYQNSRLPPAAYKDTVYYFAKIKRGFKKEPQLQKFLSR